MSVVLNPEYSLIGNPIRVVVGTTASAKVPLEVLINNQVIYEAAAIADTSGSCIFHINDVLSSYFTHTFPHESEELLSPVPDTALSYQVRATDNTGVKTVTGKCFMGGISKENYRRLIKQGTDIFKAKLFNLNHNFFLTSRSDHTIIPIRENEVGYLYFISQGKSFVIRDLYENELSIPISNSDQVYALNLNLVRKSFFDKGSLSSWFSVNVDNKVVCELVIVPGKPSSIVLAFKNSFGLFELLELSGKVTLQPEIESQESFQEWDSDIYDFKNTNSRLSYHHTLLVDSGYKTTQEMSFLLDALLSDRIYLLDGKKMIPVQISSSKFNYQRPLDEPTSLEIKIVAADKDSFLPTTLGMKEACFLQ